MSDTPAVKAVLSFFRWGYPYAILWICCVHLTIAFGLVVRESTVNLLIISGLNKFLEVPFVDRFILAAVLAVGALLALAGLGLEKRISPRKALLLMIWQYGFVVASTLSGLIVLFGGFKTAAGVQVDFVTILVVLSYSLFAGLFHTLSILERFVIEPRRKTV